MKFISDILIFFHMFNYYYLCRRIYLASYSILFLTIYHRIVCLIFICFYFATRTCLFLRYQLNLLIIIILQKVRLNMNNHQNNSTEQSTDQIEKLQEQVPSQRATVDFFLNIFYQKNRHNQNGAKQLFSATNKSMMGFGSLNYHPNQSRGVINSPYINSQHNFCPSNNGSNYWYVLATILLAGIVIILVIDMQSQYDKEFERQQIRIGQCLKQYQQSQCDDPVDILIQKCKELRECYHNSPNVKISIVFTKVLAHIFNTFIQELGLISLAVFLLIVLFFVWRPNWNYTHTYTPNDTKYSIKND